MEIKSNSPLSEVVELLPFLSKRCKDGIEAEAVKRFGAFNTLTIDDLAAISRGDLSGILGEGWQSEPTVLQWSWSEYARRQMEQFVKALERFAVPETAEERQAAEGLPSVSFIEGLLVFAQSFFSLPSYVEAAKTTIGDIVIARKAEFRKVCMQRKLDRIQAQRFKSKK